MTTYTADQAVAAYNSHQATSFTVVDTAAHITADLAGLANIASSRDLTSLTISDGVPITITGATYIADRSAFVTGTYSIAVSTATAANADFFSSSHISSVAIIDSAANVGTNLGNIHFMNIFNVPYTVTLTDSGTVHFNNVSVSDWTSNRSVFSAIQGSNFTVTLAGPVSASSVVGITGLSYLSSVSVSDTAAGIGQNLDVLEAAFRSGKLTSLALSNPTAPVPITVAQMSSDADVLALLPSNYTLAVSINAAGAASAAALPHVTTISVSDTGTNLGANLDALQALTSAGKLSSVTETDYSLLTITPAQVTADAQALAKFNFYALDEIVPAASAGTAIFQGNVIAITISDTAANISANMTTIRTLANELKVNGIMVTDGGVLHVTDDQYSTQNDWRAFLKGSYSIAISGVDYSAVSSRFFDSHVVSVGVVDTSQEIGYEMDGLELLAKSGKLTSIGFTDAGAPTLALTSAQITSDADALNLINTGFSVSGVGVSSIAALSANTHIITISVSDTLANITNGMAGLESLASAGKLGQVMVTGGNYGSGTPAGSLTLNQAQWVAEQSVVTSMSGYFNLTLQGLTADQAVAAERAPTQSVTIVDSSAHVLADLDSLELLAARGELKSITFTDTTAPTWTLTSTQISNDSNVLDAIISPYSMSSNGAVTVAGLKALPAGSRGLTLTDYSQNIGDNLDLLEADVKAGIVTAINFSGPAAFMSLTQAQYSADTDALALLPNFGVTLTGVSAVAASSALSQAHVTAVTVSDTAANIMANMATLQPLQQSEKVASITVSDGGGISLTQSQLTSDTAFLDTLQGAHYVILTGVAASSAAIDTTHHDVGLVAVSDTSANVLAYLDTLQNLAQGNKLASVTLTDSSTPTLTLSTAQMNNDAQAIAAITGNYKLAATSLPISLFGSLISNGHIASASVLDSAANVATNLDSLSAAASAGTLTSIALTDFGTPTLTLTHTQMSSDAAALHLLLGNYALQVTGVSVADTSAVGATTNVTGIGVSDSAANIGSDLDGLQALLSTGKLTALVIMDGGSLTVTAAQMVSDAQVINDIAGNYALTISNASLSSLSPTIISHAAALSINDSGANISSNLDALQSVAAAGKLTGVTITDSGFSTIAVSSSQLVSDAQALNDLSGNFIVKIDASAANLTLSGLSAHGNVASFSATASEYSITAGSGGTVTITDTGTGRSSTDHLSGLTAIQFGDHTDIVAQTPGTATVTTGNVTELYGAVFGRLPDVPGLNYYEQELQATPSLPLTTFAQWFLASPEYTSNPAHNYAQTSAGDAQFITDSYTNLLGRVPEAAAIPYYQNIINFFTNGLTPGTAAYTAALAVGHSVVLTDFSASNEFLGDVTVTAQNPSSTQHWLLLTS